MNDQQDVVFDDQDGEEVYVGPEDNYEQDEGIADPDDDMDMLQNEAPGGAAVDDDGPDE